MFEIFCVTNRRLCKNNFLDQIEKIAKCKVSGIILREKDLSTKEYYFFAKEVMKICKAYNVKCILHSYVDVAIELEAKAIHVPMHILKNMTVNEKHQFNTLGASCHNVAEAREAQRLGCTYITAGHIFETDCKKGLVGRGIEFLKEMCRAVDIPVYGIGGIDSMNIYEVQRAGAKGACIMSKLMQENNISEYLRNLEVQNEV